MLLEAAGRTGASRSKQSHQSSRRRHNDSYSDDGSYSKDDDSDDARGHGRKPSRSQVPLKKRSKNGNDDQGNHHDEDHRGDRFDRENYSSDDSDVGSDLYKDENDREQLSKLTELEREMILSDRAAKKDDRKLHKQMRSRLISDKKSQSAKDTSPLSSTRGLRSSTRYADRTAAKADVLKELKARRMKRDSEGKQRMSNEHSGSPNKKKGATASSSVSSSGSENGSDSHSDDEGSMGDGRMDYSDDERDKTDSDVPTYEQIRRITIRRSKLAKWFLEPFFEDLIVGCFVRVGIGMKNGQSIYRLCIVQNVDASDPNKKYHLDNKNTHKYLNCVWGSDRSAARWQMARISDSPPTLEEFTEWRREVIRTSGRMPHRDEVLEKREAIDKINNFVYSAETVKQMLQEKKSASTRPKNIAAEKEKLRRELEVAEYKEDEVEIDRIKTRLQELEAAQHNPVLDAKARRLAEMNRKNRAENFRVSSMRASDRCLNPGDAGYDPFSRRWTRSRNYYAPKQDDGTGTKTEGTGQRGDVDNVSAPDAGNSKGGGAKAGAETGLASNGAGKLVDTNAPVDQGTESNTLHNFELPISLSLLQSFGGAYGAAAGFLARKQKIEATIGCQLPEDGGRRHPMALSVGDYKRRRGITYFSSSPPVFVLLFDFALTVCRIRKSHLSYWQTWNRMSDYSQQRICRIIKTVPHDLWLAFHLTGLNYTESSPNPEVGFDMVGLDFVCLRTECFGSVP
ncbi:hypothetical protein Cgig2_020772 [Carnegiea gigantea]|uniref:Plus3 domain-containing protein n=1 Tax=Carnegiea gigantea TaxID=171969 RepID=A0A9Q1K250_9CARY|nr:hypothetical protein Cgig2_020772 [Carnegiea gigantea]